MADAHRAAERGALLTPQLLAFARQQPLRPEVHDLNALIYAARSRAAAGHGRATSGSSCRSAAGWAKSTWMPAEFEAALLNLVVNARDAMPNGGRIVLGTREHVQKEKEGRRPPGRYVVVTVEDTGTGMPPEVIEHAIEPFFTTKEVGKGSGLGLSQVYGFAVQSGGDVVIGSTVGKGTTISFYLPVRTGDASLAQGDSGAPVKVLLVEDDPEVQAMTVESLRFLGYSVLTADKGHAALEILRRDPGIQLLFTDIVMPKGMSGVDLLREARGFRPHLRVLLASGYARGQLPTITEDCDFIAKPYRVEDLQKRLAALLAQRS